MTVEQPTQPWYTKTWVVILALWLFFPVGLYLMWRFTRWEVWVKAVVSAVISLLVILFVVGAAIGGDEVDDEQVSTQDATPSPTVNVEATQTASASEAATAAAEEEEMNATATAEALSLAATASAEAEVMPTVTPMPEPVGNIVLASDLAGGWLNIDFLWRDNPLQESKECVTSHADAEAVACFAFASEANYEASEPESAGNFKGLLCWDARWQRNKLGDESGGENLAKDAACPD